MKSIIRPGLLILLLSAVSCGPRGESGMEFETLAQQRFVEKYDSIAYWRSEFYTSFFYTPVSGLRYEPGISRRDPSTVIRVGNTYYVYYTRTPDNMPAPAGYTDADENTPATSWDMASIYYATSLDGFEWEEMGLAVGPGPEGNYDDRSVFTPDVMVWEGKYYLYYQAVSGIYRSRTINVIGMSWAENPAGPWYRHERPVFEPHPSGEWEGDSDDRSRVREYGAWDSHKVHDPNLIVRDGKFWMYYKGVPKGRGSASDRGIAMGLAIADSPEGPFIRPVGSPVTNSGHEVLVWPYREGVVTLITVDGYEKNTIQYAPDGINFEVKASITLPPIAAGAYRPDAYTDTRNGDGITWGLCHMEKEPWNFLVRFDCDLSQSIDRKGFHRQNERFNSETYLSSEKALK